MGVQAAEAGRLGRTAAMFRGALADMQTGIHMVAAPDIPTTPQAFDTQSQTPTGTGPGRGRRIFDTTTAFLATVASAGILHAPLAAAQEQGTGVLCVAGEVRTTPLPNKEGLLIVFDRGVSAAHITTSLLPAHRRTPDASRRTVSSVKGRNGHDAWVVPQSDATKVGVSGSADFTVTLSGSTATCA